MRKMADNTQPFTIEQFYKFTSQCKLMAAQCLKCGYIMLPPRPVCSRCYSKNMQWREVKTEGTLQTYTVIHIAPAQFQSMAPYAVGIVQFEDGLRIPGMIRGVEPDKLKIGMKLKIEFDTTNAACSPTQPTQWPAWLRYYFKPA